MTPSIPFSNTHIQESLLATAEKRILIAMAKRLPGSINPDHLTIVGFGSMILAGITYAMADRWPPALLIVNLWLALNWFGDSLDGTLARVRNKQRPRYGYYVDHIIDALSATFLFGGLAVSSYMHPAIAVGMLLCYLLLAINSYLAAQALGEFRISWWKFSPTEMRILLAAGNVVAFLRPDVLGGRYLFFDVAGGISILCMTAVLVTMVIRNTAALYRLERV